MFGVRGWQWWRTVALPGIFPYYVTGALTASGGSWNASIVAEAVSWGGKRLRGRPRLLHRRCDGRRGLSPRRARHRGDVGLRHRLQPAAVAATLQLRRAPPAPRLNWTRKARHGSSSPPSAPSSRSRACAIITAPVARRGTPVIDEVDLTLDEGEIVGLLGRSGSGKSDACCAPSPA